jgi:hypothetical protein
MATQVTTNTYTQKILFTGTEAAIAAATRSNDGLYFATDTHKIYKGSEDYSQAARVVTALPNVVAKNALYVLVDNEGNFVKAVATDGTGAQKEISWVKSTALSASSTDNEVASAKAVYDYVQGIVGGDTVVTSVAASSQAGALTITQGSATTSTTVVPGVALKPTWESTDRVLTIPYTTNGADAAGSVVVNIGKDMVVDYAEYDHSTEKILMWISTSDHTTDPADIEIPVGDLIDEIVGGETSTAVTTYTSSTNTMTAAVKVSAKTGNYLSVVTGDATAANNGLMVDLSSVEQDIADNATDIGTLDDNMAALETALTTWTVLSE